ncbi:MAG: hypothetical protein A3H97_24050 [Acidobacteria bacterium RIFCSPLOWO2_02_FULL_65_29]|nr:MAG: hypothetical protein A3H97_24050 [Acidobacteria bacterium RIFCSPLOWO2_02_FULL_65_29]
MRTLVAALLMTLVLLAGDASLRAQTASRFASMSGEQAYDAACAACHGTDGRGNPKSVVGFDVPLPDFTDCTFSTPEPDGDWGSVIHLGGPARAFSRVMPAFGEALSDEDIDKLVGYLRGFCTDPSWPLGDLNLPRPLVTEKAFPENETVISMAIAHGDEASVATDVVYERRLGKRSQFELAVPVELQKGAGGTWQRGLGDVVFAVKHALFHSRPAGSILSVGVEAVFPTGKETERFGKGVNLFEPFVAFGQMLPSDGFLHLHSGVELPADTDKSSKEAFWRMAIGKSFMENGGLGRAWTPMVELVGAKELVDEEDAQWDIVPQMQITLSKRQHIMINAGLRIPLTSRAERHVQVLTYFLWDWFDGGLFDGWR